MHCDEIVCNKYEYCLLDIRKAKQMVRCRTSLSTDMHVTNGVPQGDVLFSMLVQQSITQLVLHRIVLLAKCFICGLSYKFVNIEIRLVNQMGLYVYSIEICDVYVWEVGVCLCVYKVTLNQAISEQVLRD